MLLMMKKTLNPFHLLHLILVNDPAALQHKHTVRAQVFASFSFLWFYNAICHVYPFGRVRVLSELNEWDPFIK